MNSRMTTIMVAMAMIIVLGVSNSLAAPAAVQPAAVKPAAAAGDYDFTTYGTGWIPEVLGQYNWWHARGWGTQAKPKTVGGKWVHIPVPYPARIADTGMRIKFVEFCAQSTNGAGGTGPNQLDLYSDYGVFYSGAISWPGDNSTHCYTYTLPTPTWYPNLGVSVRLNFANTTDMITLYKAWVRIIP